jgi:hypothetical protein
MVLLCVCETSGSNISRDILTWIAFQVDLVIPRKSWHTDLKYLLPRPYQIIIYDYLVVSHRLSHSFSLSLYIYIYIHTHTHTHTHEGRGLTLLLPVGTLWRCGDGLFFEVPPLASDALLTTLHPLHGARSGLNGGYPNVVPPIHLFQAEHWAFPTMKMELQCKKFRSDQRSAARFRELGWAL